MATENKCPHCGKPVPATALQGICPECMLKAGLSAETGEVGPGGTIVAKPPPQPVPRVDEIAPHFPQLEILECLGRGGMGAVYKARQPKLDRLVALKILTRNHDSTISDTEFTARFQQEARALARLNHPDIVAVYDFGEAGGYHYLLMEYVDGLTLRQLLQTRKLSPEEALSIVPKICEALQFAHERGIVHRDIKPENILLDKQGQVKIADFGIAKILGTQAADRGLTGAKDVIGTPHYMAPEQIEKPAKVDHRADIYSLGVVFYEMLTGELPLGNFQRPSHKVQVDVRLDEVVLHALEKEPDRRYQHASEIKTDVETIASSPATERPGSTSPADRGDTGRFTSSLLPELLSGERVVHFKRRVWGVFNYSPPLVFRLFFSLPPLWEAGLYVTDRRILLVAHVLGVFGQEFSIWFSRNLEEGRRELFQKVSTGKSLWLGDCLDIRSEAPQRHWYRGQELLLRIYTRQPELLREKIVAAKSGTAIAETPAPSSSRMEARNGTGRPVESAWVTAARWTARVLSLLLLAFYGFFMLAEGLPPVASQPEGVQLNFAALGLMLLGFVIGWKRDGAAALLIAAGWTLWHIAEGHMRWNLFQTPLPVAALFGFCWWATQGRKTGVVVGTAIALSALLGFGRLFVPTSVFVRGAVLDAQNGKPVPNAELRLMPRPPRALEKGDPPSARSGNNGRFGLYVGWYAEDKEVAISAPGYAKLTTNLGPRALGARELSRDFLLIPALESSTRPAGNYLTALVTKGDLTRTIMATGSLRPLTDDPTQWQIHAGIAEADVAPVEAGQPVNFTVDAFPGRKFTGKLRQLGNDPIIQQNVVTYDALIAVKDPEPKFKPGMTAYVSVIVAQRESALRVPNAALRVRLPGIPQPTKPAQPDERRVYRLRGGESIASAATLIKVGISDGGFTEVTAGLSEGDRVVVGLGPETAEQNPRTTSAAPAASPTTAANPADQVPPVVIETIPESGAADVDPALTELRATFSKPMQNGNWAWCKWGEENFPELTGESKFLEDQRTCVLPVRLQPGKVYALWLNSDYHQNFKDREGQSAVPYLLIFKTRK